MQRKQIISSSIPLVIFYILLLPYMQGCDNKEILVGVVDSDSILEIDKIRHGVDIIHVYKVSSDQRTLNRMISSWNLVPVSNDEGMTFLNGSEPKWWRDINVVDWERFSQSNDVDECYWSVWYSPSEKIAYVEIGQW